MEGLLGSVIQSQAVPRIRARMLKPAPGEEHLICSNSNHCAPSAKAQWLLRSDVPSGLSLSQGEKAPNLCYFDRTHFKGQAASAEGSSIKTVQRGESKSAVFSVAI